MNPKPPQAQSKTASAGRRHMLPRFAAGLLSGWNLITVLAAAVIIAPLCVVVFGLGATGPEWEELAQTVLGDYIANTVIMVALVAALSLLFAVPAAWILSVYEFPGRRLLEWALVLPLAIPTYVAAFVYIEIPEACIPLLVAIRNHWGVQAFQTSETVLRYGVLAVLMTAVLFPYLYLTARASFSRQHRSLIEAALMLGRSPASVFRTVALPLSRPAIAAGLSLIVMEVVNDYGAVNYFGVPTLTEGVFRTWFGLEDPASGTRLASFMMLAILLMVLLERRLRGRARFAAKGSAEMPLSRRPLRGGKCLLAWLLCGVPLLLGLVYPLAQLALWAVRATRHSLPSFESFQGTGSLLIALATAVMIGALALLMVYSLRLHPAQWLRGLVNAASLGYAMPGVAVAVGVMICAGTIDGRLTLPFLLGGSVGAIVFGYTVRFIAVPLHALHAGMTRICGSLDEASRSLGHGAGSTLLRINLPLLRGPLIASVMLVFIDILKELPLTMLLRPAGFNTLAVSAFGMAKEGRIYEAALPALLIIAAGALGVIVLNRFMETDGQ